MNKSKEIQVKASNEDIIKNTSINSEQQKRALITAAVKTFGGAVAGVVPGLREFIGVVNTINDEVREEKLNNLLISFRNRFESVEAAQRRFEFITGSRGGMLLFHKIVHIVDNGPLDEEWLNLLAIILERISDEDIESQFEERSYILAQISNLSPHALILLSKNEFWSKIKFDRATTMSGQTIVGDWDRQVSVFFAGNVGIDSDDTKVRVAHGFKELESAGMVHITEAKSLDFTAVGVRVRSYLS